MRYRMRDGLIIESVCGKPLLAATRKARRYCPYLTELNESSLFVVRMLEEGLDTEDMVIRVSERYEIDPEVAASSLGLCLATLQEQNYILPLEDEE